MSTQGDFLKVIERAQEQGFRHRKLGNGHHQLLSPNGHDIVHASGTMSDYRAFANFLGEMKKAGYKPNGDSVATTSMGDALQAAREKAAGAGLVVGGGQKKSAATVVIEVLTLHGVGATSAEMVEAFAKARPDVTDARSNVSGALTRLVDQGQIERIVHGKYRLAQKKETKVQQPQQPVVQERPHEVIGVVAAPPIVPAVMPTPSPAITVTNTLAPPAAPRDHDERLNAAVDMILEGVAQVQQLLTEHRVERQLMEQVRKMLGVQQVGK